MDSGGIQNAHFGLTHSGEIFTGYLSEKEVLNKTFKTLVGGVIWLLRHGEIYVDESSKVECSKTEKTGTLKRFINVISARTAVGHDTAGRVVFAHVDGKTDESGINLYEFAELLKSFNVINAINLDGGGSSTMVVNETVVNYPSDLSRYDPRVRVARRVSTILCVKSSSARNNSSCIGMCVNRGTCNVSAGHCICHSGFYGKLCEKTCTNGYWGVQCKHPCACNSSCHSCDPHTGKCYSTDCQDGKMVPAFGRDRTWWIPFVSVAVIASISITLNIIICALTYCHNELPKYSKLNTYERSRQNGQTHIGMMEIFDSNEEDD